MAIFRAAGSKKSPAFSVALSLIASLLVLVGPFTDRSDAYTDFTNFTTAGAITYNDKICNLGDPAMRQSSATAFEISTSDQLWEVTDCVSTSATIYFKLGGNINVSEAVFAPTASPIGYSTSNGIAHSFSGVLDGQNKVISGISMSTTSYGVGLFALLESATVSNLVIEGSFVTTYLNNSSPLASAAGSLAMASLNTLSLISISNRAQVTGVNNVGGIIGFADDTLTVISSSNTATISGGAQIGGLVGNSWTSQIIRSSNFGAISGSNFVGGLAGYSNLISIHSSSNTATISGSDAGLGGLVGFAGANSQVIGSINLGSVYGDEYLGGLVGESIGISIVSSKNSGFVSGSGGVIGGLIGQINDDNNGYQASTISDSYNMRPVTGGGIQVGGLIGYASGDIDLTILSSSNNAPVTGNDFVGGLAGSATTLTILTSSNNAPVTGNGSVGGLAGSAGTLRIVLSSNNASVAGRDNVGGLSGFGTTVTILRSSNNAPVIGNNFVSGLSGHGTTVTILSSSNNAPVTGNDHVGGLSGDAGTLTILSSSNKASVAGRDNVGGLAGAFSSVAISASMNTGPVSGRNSLGGLAGGGGSVAISASMNSGTISGSGFIGGLIGSAFWNANIDFSFNSGNVLGSGDYAGGLIGYVSEASIGVAYNSGPVFGSSGVGGLVGNADFSASISNTFNAGAVRGIATVGGLAGRLGVNALGGKTILTSYNTGTVVGDNNVDGLIGVISGVATVSALYSSQATSHGTVSASANMKVASAFVGFDFASIWGFGRTNNNQGFPILCVLDRALPCFSDFPRPASSNSSLVGLVISEGTLNPVFSQLNTAYSATVSNSITSIRVTPTKADAEAVIAVNGTAVPSGVASSAIALSVGNNTINIVVTAADLTTTTYALVVNRAGSGSEAPDPVSSAPQAANYVGPMITIPRSARVGTEVVFTGTRLESATRVFAGGIELSVSALVSESKTLKLPTALRPGTYDLIVLSGFGTLTVISGLTVLDPTVPAPEPEAPKKVLSVGTFKGYIAIYTKGYEGSKLSAKVAGKWLVVPVLKESWKSKGYSRKVRFTGAGYSIQVRLFIDKAFQRTLTILTR